MNYAQARERKDDSENPSGLWFWTTGNDGRLYCTEPCTLDCKHANAEDAEKHFYEYCLSNAKEFENRDEKHKCKVCNEWTQKGLRNWSLDEIHVSFYLCDAHRNIYELRKLHPFESGIQIIHS